MEYKRDSNAYHISEFYVEAHEFFGVSKLKRELRTLLRSEGFTKIVLVNKHKKDGIVVTYDSLFIEQPNPFYLQALDGTQLRIRLRTGLVENHDELTEKIRNALNF